MRWMGQGLGLTAAFLIGLDAACAQDNLALQARALVVIAETANSICISVTQGGEQKSATLSGETTAKLDGAISKVAELNVRGTGQLASQEYRGVLQTELASTLRMSQDCKKAVFDTLVVKMLPTVTTETGLQGTQGIHLRPRTVEQPSPGVDCDKTNEPIEDLICADADLAQADGLMGRRYRQKMQRLSAADQTSLRQQQRNWIKLRDSTCNVPTHGSWKVAQLAPTKPCILQMTQRRANELAN